MDAADFTVEQIEEIEKIKRQMMDKQQVVLLSNKKQKIKLIKLGRKVYEVIYNYGDNRFDNCIIDMVLSKTR